MRKTIFIFCLSILTINANSQEKGKAIPNAEEEAPSGTSGISTLRKNKRTELKRKRIVARQKKKEHLYSNKFDINSTHIIIYDGETGTLKNVPFHIREGRTVTMQYINVNPYVVEKGLTVKTINKDYELGSNTFTSLNILAKEAEAAAGQNADEQSEEKITLPKPTDIDNQLLKMSPLEGEEKEDDKEVSNKSIYSIEKNLFHEISESLDIINTDINKTKRILKINPSLTNATQQVNNNTKDKMIADIIKKVGEEFSSPDNVRTAYQDAIDNITEQITQIEDNIKALEFFDEALKKNGKANLSTRINEIKTKLSALKSEYTGDKLNEKYDAVQTIIENYANIINAKYVVTDKITSTVDDYLVFAQPSLDIDSFRIKTTGGVRVDFSIGLSATYGDINGWEYRLRRPNSNTAYIETNKGTKDILFNPVVFAHLYKTNKHNYNIMYSIGLSPDITELSDTKLHLGASISGISTNKLFRRMVFTAGVAAGQADVLKKEYKVIDQSDSRNILINGTVEDSDLTTKAIKVGAFVAVSWNL